MDTITVIVGGRNEIRREGLAKILEAKPEIEVLGTSPSKSDAIRKVHELSPDIVIYVVDAEKDVAEFTYLEAKRDIGGLPKSTRLIALGDSDEDGSILMALKLGARAYLSKDIPIQHLVAAIATVNAGDVIIPPRMAAKMLGAFDSIEKQEDIKKTDQSYGLSKREIEVLSLVSGGTTNKEIADALFISENTVKVHLRSVLEKLNVRNRQEAAVLAIEKGIVPRRTETDMSETS